MQSVRSPQESRREPCSIDRTNPVEKNRAFVRFTVAWVITALWMGCMFIRAEFIFSGSFYYLNFGITVALFAVMFGYLGRYFEHHDEQTAHSLTVPHSREADGDGRQTVDR